MDSKSCTKCGETKRLREFGVDKRHNRYTSACRECERERGRIYGSKRRETKQGKYTDHQNNAARRGIEFNLSFAEWLLIWEESGKFEQRGRGAGTYCMSRIGDIGPYELGNVFIQLNKVNTSEGNLGKVLSDETKAKMSAASIGKPKPWMGGKSNPMHRQEAKDKISAATGGANHYKARGVNTPDGFFATARLAAEALGMKKSTVEWRASHNKFGFSRPAIA